MSVLKTFSKTAVERRRLYVDYGCWLEDTEILTDIQVVVSPLTEDAPLTADVAFADVTNKKITFFAGAGVGNTLYTIQMIVRTNAGQVKRDDIGMRVLP